MSDGNQVKKAVKGQIMGDLVKVRSLDVILGMMGSHWRVSAQASDLT